VQWWLGRLGAPWLGRLGVAGGRALCTEPTSACVPQSSPEQQQRELVKHRLLAQWYWLAGNWRVFGCDLPTNFKALPPLQGWRNFDARAAKAAKGVLFVGGHIQYPGNGGAALPPFIGNQAYAAGP